MLCHSRLARKLGESYPIYGIQVPNFSVNQPYNADIKTIALSIFHRLVTSFINLVWYSEDGLSAQLSLLKWRSSSRKKA
ncbi:amino acid adenylation domain-containing protein [Pectobacterium atrosepticum ICMP 1526]|nr:amino acid adenylation domain-containing protein [Pectobacterium atrosepticum ICMP 1526]